LLSISEPDPTHLDFGPDGKTLLAYFRDKTIQLWDLATGERRGDPIGTKELRGTSSYCWACDGTRLFGCDGLKSIAVFDVTSGKALRKLEVDATNPGVIAASSDGKWCAHATPGGTVKVRDAVTGAESHVFRGFKDPVAKLVSSPDGSRLLGVDSGGELIIWDCETGREIAAIHLPDVSVVRVRYSPGGKRLAVVGLQERSMFGELRVLDAQTVAN
jgi:WD40 repeat protein